MAKRATTETTEQPEATPTEQPATEMKIQKPAVEGMVTAEFTPPPVLPSDNKVAPTDETGDVTEGKETEQTPQEKLLTQAEFERALTARLKQERQKYADYDDLKAKVQAAEEAQKSEADKQAERLRQLEEQNQQLSAQAQQALVRAAITAAASEIGLDANAAYKLADLDSLTIENGEATNAAEIVKAVAEAYPGLIRRGSGAQATAANPARATEPKGRTDEDRRRDYFGGNASGFWSTGGVRGLDQ